MLAAADISNKKYKNEEKGLYFHRSPLYFFVKIGNYYSEMFSFNISFFTFSISLIKTF